MHSFCRVWDISVKLVRVWVVCFVVFFGSAELYQWVQGITLPMPVMVIAGVLLAIAANTDQFPRKSVLPPTPVDPLIPPMDVPAPTEAPPSRFYPGAQLPNLSPQASRSISFTIRSPGSVSPHLNPPNTQQQ